MNPQELHEDFPKSTLLCEKEGKTMRKRVSICLICLAFVALTFFSFIDVQVVEAQEKPVLKFGSSNPLSGPAVGWGLPGDRLLKMLADKINKEGGLKVGDKVYTVKALSYDHKWIQAESVSVLKRAIADGCVFTIGLLGEENTRPLARVSNENRHIVVSCMAGSAAVTNPKNPYIFRAMASDDILMGIVAPKLFKKKGWKRIYIVTQDNTMGHSGIVSLKRGIKDQGLEGVLVGEDYLPVLTQDFTPALTRALAAKPDAIECGAWPPGPIATFVKQARELG
ncbi:ABC transporter substrate-binding protein, partial [bacterium]|nr:ABC transporter substrate-binding protein [bacterium]